MTVTKRVYYVHRETHVHKFTRAITSAGWCPEATAGTPQAAQKTKGLSSIRGKQVPGLLMGLMNASKVNVAISETKPGGRTSYHISGQSAKYFPRALEREVGEGGERTFDDQRPLGRSSPSPNDKLRLASPRRIPVHVDYKYMIICRYI